AAPDPGNGLAWTRKEFLHLVGKRLQVVGMRRIGGQRAQQFVRREALDARHRRTQIAKPAVRAGERDGVRAVLDERAELALALAQRFVGVLQRARALRHAHLEPLLGVPQLLRGANLVGDVAGSAEHQLATRYRTPREDSPAAVLVPHATDERIDTLAFFHLPFDRFQRALAIIGVYQLHVRYSQRLVDAVAQHVGDRGAQALEVPVGARDGEDVDGQVEEPVEFGFGARAAGEVAAYGEQRDPHAQQREGTAADDHPARDQRATLRQAFAIVELHDLRVLHLLGEPVDLGLQRGARPCAVLRQAPLHALQALAAAQLDDLVT